MAPNDIKLAAAFSSLDIIIGGHAEDFHAYPIIAANSIEGKLYYFSAGNTLGCGKIEIDLDDQGQKKDISFINKSLQNSAPNRAKPAA